MNRSEDEKRRRALIADQARKLWLEGTPIRELENITGASYHLFRSCIEDTEPDFFDIHERKRGRKFRYKHALEVDELAAAVRIYLLKEMKFWKICAKFNIAPYMLRQLLKEAGVWRSQGGQLDNAKYRPYSEPVIPIVKPDVESA